MLLLVLVTSLLIGAAIFALFAAIALKLAYRVVLKDTMEYGEAFKLMFIAAIMTQIVYIALWVVLSDQEVLLMILPALVLFVVVTLLLGTKGGLMLGQAAGVAAVMTVIWIAFSFATQGGLMLVRGAGVGAS